MMPVLDNPKWEIYAQALAKGKTATEAMELAGYADPRNSTRLTKNEEISARVIELKESIANRAVEKSAISKAWLLQMLEQNAKLAQEAGKFEASTSAIKTLGSELYSMFIAKSETGTPGSFDRMSDVELEQFIAEKTGGARKETLQ